MMCRQFDYLVVIASTVVAGGFAVPVYRSMTDTAAASGWEISWAGHAGFAVAAVGSGALLAAVLLLLLALLGGAAALLADTLQGICRSAKRRRFSNNQQRDAS